MKDPYVVLGISPTATDEEVKKAYRDLARKYHPDAYQNNPLADLAEEKMKEINEAHDTITKIRKGGQVGGGFAQGNPYQNTTQQDPIYQQIRAMIQSGNIQGAEALLLQQQSNPTAEWHFLMGIVKQRKGWVDEARQHFNMACQMAPQNPEYQQALYTMGQNSNFQGKISPCCCCCPCDGDCCSTLLCLNCLCGDGCCC